MGFSENLKAAQMAIDHVRWVCRYGAANRSKDQERFAFREHKQIRKVEDLMIDGISTTFEKTLKSMPDLLNETLVAEYENLCGNLSQRKDLIPIEVSLASKYRTGTCETQASVAFDFLRKLNQAWPIDFMAIPNTHAFVVIGRTGDAKSPTSWGPDAVVCDPWINEDPSPLGPKSSSTWSSYPYKPDAWAAMDLVLGGWTPQKAGSYNCVSEYRLTGPT